MARGLPTLRNSPERTLREEASDRHARAAVAFAVALMIGTSVLLAFQTPTFDLDEALYRRVAEEMKVSHHYGTLTWDQRPFLEKPPTYVWTIVAFSRLIDRDSRVSLIAARLPSLLFSALTVLSLCLFWSRFSREYAGGFGVTGAAPKQIAASPLLPAVAFGAALFPMVQVTSVLLDPMLTFFTTIVLLVFSAAMLRRKSTALQLSPAETVIAGLAMAAAVAVKGLIGIAAPAIALFVHDILTTVVDDAHLHRLSAFRRRLIGTARGAGISFVIATGLSALLYFFFCREAGPAFFHEFIIRQHFARGAKAFQGHHGSIFYYAILLFVGGPVAAFACVALGVKRRKSFSFAQWGFPLSWAAGLIVFISLLATKLPNYSWPAWTAIVLSFCILLVRITPSDGVALPRVKERLARVSVVCAWIGIVATALLCLTAAAASAAFRQIVPHLTHSAKTDAILDSILPLPLSVRIGLGLIAIAFALQALLQWQYLKRVTAGVVAIRGIVARAAALNCLVLVIASMTAIPYMNQKIRMPLVRVAQLASVLHAPGEGLTTVGLFSPTISSNYIAGPVNQIGTLEPRSAPAGRQLRIAPVWRASSCLQSGFSVLTRDEYLLLCAAGPLRIEEAPFALTAVGARNRSSFR